jgi:Abnormal spindle-like microcephaly-assoc'd, ASPM-SPD-2-Hydin
MAMYFGTLDHVCRSADNQSMPRMVTLRARLVGGLLALAGLLVLAGCAGISSASKQPPPPGPTTGQLSVSPSTMSFGNVSVGSNASQTATLTAGIADVAVASAAWNGDGYSVSGITFPVTVPSGQSVKYTVTFAPPAAGSAPGSISFVSDASDSSLTQTLTGSGTQASSSHTVALSWGASTSSVVGYNIYRGAQSGGPYSRLNSTPMAGTSFTDNTVASGATYYYVATSVDSNSSESTYSNQATAEIPNQ